MSLESIILAIWTYPFRTLAQGEPREPENRAEQIAQALWTYEPRTLTEKGATLAGASVAPAAISAGTVTAGRSLAGASIAPAAVSVGTAAAGRSLAGASIAPAAVSAGTMEVGAQPITLSGASIAPAAVSAGIATAGRSAAGASIAPAAISAGAATAGRVMAGASIAPAAISSGRCAAGVGGYRLYRGVGSPDAIDWETPVGLSPAGERTIRHLAAGLEPLTTYWYGLRAISDAGVEEPGAACLCRVETDQVGQVIPPAPNPMTYARAEPLPQGYIRVHGHYDARGQAGRAAAVQVARIADGEIGWTHLAGSVAAAGGRWSVTIGPYADGELLRLACRAATSAGVGGPWYRIPDVAAETEAPAPLDAIEVRQV